ncbi:DUF1761 domain-containing protein [Paenarthrobacter sp. NPDC089675]|uniref:DUF1761 domain-containing protein n=1 Tax=Paenarthrobacter sp. NPDC089675 TaxID=3364376 RepID=UPI0038207E25
MDWLSHLAQVNWLAVLLAFVSSMVVGFLWYMPAVLGRRWMQAIGKTEEDLKNIDGGPGIWVPMMLASALTSVLLAVLASALELDTWWSGALFGLIVAVVFRAGGHVIHNGFAGRPSAVTVIDSGHDVVALAIAGAIIGAMQ